MNIFNEDFQDFIVSLNKHNVEYMLVGGYAVILRGYSRSTGDMDIWVNKSESNFLLLQKAIVNFGMPSQAIRSEQFFSDEYDVFSFGRPPYAIEIMTAVKGVDFYEAFQKSTVLSIDEIDVRVIHLQHLIAAKKAAGRHKDLNDIENLPPAE
jgi:predicted nucleotidyltransferase